MGRLPPVITRRLAATLVCERVGEDRLARHFRRPGLETLDARELGAFHAMLLQFPEAGGPGVHLHLEPVRTDCLATFAPPNVPEDLVRFARPCDQAGAIPDAVGLPRHEPHGSIGYWLDLAGLAFSARQE